MNPTGTVTFLLTDIEGSTRLWEEHAPAMSLALARHDALLRDAVECDGDLLFKRVGDAFYCAFPWARAAPAAQRALDSQAWLAPVRLQVRRTVHTGAAETRDAH